VRLSTLNTTDTHTTRGEGGYGNWSLHEKHACLSSSLCQHYNLDTRSDIKYTPGSPRQIDVHRLRVVSVSEKATSFSRKPAQEWWSLVRANKSPKLSAKQSPLQTKMNPFHLSAGSILIFIESLHSNPLPYAQEKTPHPSRRSFEAAQAPQATLLYWKEEQWQITWYTSDWPLIA